MHAAIYGHGAVFVCLAGVRASVAANIAKRSAVAANPTAAQFILDGRGKVRRRETAGGAQQIIFTPDGGAVGSAAGRPRPFNGRPRGEQIDAGQNADYCKNDQHLNKNERFFATRKRSQLPHLLTG